MDNKAFYVVNSCGRKIEARKVNIDGSDDMFYRYKVHQLIIQVVGKGKMIKTMLINNDEVARGLHLNPEYIPAYMGYEIGAQFKYENKKPENQRAHISGEYTSNVLSDVLKKLIKEWILCKSCNAPELKMSCETKKKTVFLTCSACGNREEMNKCNMKFLQFIAKNPPVNAGGVEAKKVNHPSRTAKKKEKEEENEEEEEGPQEGEESTEVAEETPSPEKESEQTQTQTIEITEEDISRTENDLKRATEEGVQWNCDTSKEAMESRRAELVPESIKQLVVSGIDSSGFNRLKALLEKNPSDDEIISLLNTLRSSNYIDDDEAVDALFPFLFQKDFVKEKKAHLKLLKVLLKSEASQISFLLRLELSLQEKGAIFIKKSSAYIKSFYDDDLIEELSVMKWYSSPVENDNVRDAAKPLIDWLQNAEEESDE